MKTDSSKRIEKPVYVTRKFPWVVKHVGKGKSTHTPRTTNKRKLFVICELSSASVQDKKWSDTDYDGDETVCHMTKRRGRVEERKANPSSNPLYNNIWKDPPPLDETRRPSSRHTWHRLHVPIFDKHLKEPLIICTQNVGMTSYIETIQNSQTLYLFSYLLCINTLRLPKSTLYFIHGIVIRLLI